MTIAEHWPAHDPEFPGLSEELAAINSNQTMSHNERLHATLMAQIAALSKRLTSLEDDDPRKQAVLKMLASRTARLKVLRESVAPHQDETR